MYPNFSLATQYCLTECENKGAPSIINAAEALQECQFRQDLQSQRLFSRPGRRIWFAVWFMAWWLAGHSDAASGWRLPHAFRVLFTVAPTMRRTRRHVWIQQLVTMRCAECCVGRPSGHLYSREAIFEVIVMQPHAVAHPSCAASIFWAKRKSSRSSRRHINHSRMRSLKRRISRQTLRTKTTSKTSLTARQHHSSVQGRAVASCDLHVSPCAGGDHGPVGCSRTCDCCWRKKAARDRDDRRQARWDVRAAHKKAKADPELELLVPVGSLWQCQNSNSEGMPNAKYAVAKLKMLLLLQPDKRPRSPMSGDPLRLKDLIHLDIPTDPHVSEVWITAVLVVLIKAVDSGYLPLCSLKERAEASEDCSN